MDRKTAIELLNDMHNCAVKAGVSKYMFIGFGTMLGALRDNGLIKHDDDMDICFLPMPPELKESYYRECMNAGLLAGWKNPAERTSSKPSGELLWFSAKKGEKTTKSCNWFFEEWDDMLWHTKGKAWVSEEHFPRKLRYKPDDEAVMLGAPTKYFGLQAIRFEGITLNMPNMPGTLCDLYYPDWFTPQEGGTSAQVYIARVGRWDDKSTWSRLK